MNTKLLVERHPVLAYFVLVYAIAWAGILLIVWTLSSSSATDPQVLVGLVGLPMLLAPGLAAVTVTAIVDGRERLKRVLAHLARWQVKPRYYAVALATLPLLTLAILYTLAVLISPAFTPTFSLLGFAAILPGFFEEIGWTGFAVKRLRARHSMLWVGVSVGVLWGFWHGLADFSVRGIAFGSFWPITFGLFVLPLVAWRILMVWVYDNTSSLLVAQLMHFSYTGSLMLFVPTLSRTDDALVYAVLAVALWIAVGVLLVVQRQTPKTTQPLSQGKHTSTYHRLVRLVAGLVVLALVLAVAFAAITPQLSRWGATADEVARRLPGDELAPRPQIQWTNAASIDARPEQVWPWVAQLGDTRAGFYSYTFIENRVGALTGASGYAVNYTNADRIVPEWQNPAPGDSIIQGTLKIREVKPGQYLLADLVTPDGGQWTWLWQLTPLDGGARTRLIVRCLMQLPPEAANPMMIAVMNAGGFVMQQRMIHGLKLRAEGGVEPASIEAVEIALWLTTLAIGLIAAVLFLFQQAWRRPLALAALAVAALVALTFIQPAIWLRVAINLALALGLWWAYQPARQRARRMHTHVLSG